MIEESVTKAVIFFLKQHKWEILDYDFPGSGTGRNFRIGSDEDFKKRKRVIPDIIAYKNNTILWFENKDRDTIADYKKVFSLSLERKNLLEQINQVYPDKLASNLFFAIAHFGESKYLKKVTEYNISTILQVVSPLPTPQINILFDPLVIFS